MRVIRGAFVVLALAAALAGCTKDPAVLKQRHLEKAQGYVAKKQYNEAIIELKNALQLDPKFAPAVHLTGQAYAAKAWHIDAIRELQRALELQPDNLAARVDLGREYVAIEAWDNALREADTIAAKDPANASALYIRAAGLNAKGQPQEALAAIDKAIAAQPAAELHTVRGNILAQLQRGADAEGAYRAALAQQPKYAPARVASGRRCAATARSTRRAVSSRRPKPTSRRTPRCGSRSRPFTRPQGTWRRPGRSWRRCPAKPGRRA